MEGLSLFFRFCTEYSQGLSDVVPAMGIENGCKRHPEALTVASALWFGSWEHFFPDCSIVNLGLIYHTHRSTPSFIYIQLF